MLRHLKLKRPTLQHSGMLPKQSLMPLNLIDKRSLQAKRSLVTVLNQREFKSKSTTCRRQSLITIPSKQIRVKKNSMPYLPHITPLMAREVLLKLQLRVKRRMSRSWKMPGLLLMMKLLQLEKMLLQNKLLLLPKPLKPTTISRC